MSLQVWLPLNGNLDNYGLGSFSPTLSNGSWDNNGKIGQCYNSNGSGVINLNNSITLDGAFSICCWVKVSSSHTSAWARVFGLYKNGNEYIGVCCNNTSPISLLGFHIYDLVNDAKKGLIDTYRIQAKLDQWTHIAVSVDGTALKMYQDGVLLFTYTLQQQVNDTYTVNQLCAQNGGSKLNCCINDFRIYDHALSPREVKEISKGLVLHYPLAMPGGNNIYINSDTVFNSNGSRLSSTTVYNGLIIDNNSPGGKYRSWDIVAENNANRGIYYTYPTSNGSLNLTENEIYTVSFYARCSKQKILIASAIAESQTILNYDGTSGNINVGTTWEKHYVTFKYTQTSKITTCFYLRSLDENVTLDIALPKLELGDHPTPWIPNSSDTTYAALGFNDGIEYDVSGYGNNGTKVGTITYDSDTPRYNTSTILNGTYISLASLTNSTISQFSICGWVNLLTGYTANYGCHLINFNKTYCRICVSKDNSAVRILLTDGTTNYSGSSAMASSSLSANVWNHYAVTFDNGSIKIYINGELDSSRTATITSISPAASWTIGNYGTTEIPKAKVSDVRFYTTALSADDVLELYHTPVSLSSNGTLLTQGELVEV